MKKKLTVLFDSQTFDIQKFGGISRMFVDIADEINDEENHDMCAKFSVLKTNNEYLGKTGLYEKGNEDNVSYTKRLLDDGDFDIFYPTFFDSYFLEHLHGKPFVMSVHDMIPELYPQFFSRRDPQIVGKTELVKHASAIEVPTNNTKRDLINILNVPEERIHIVGRGLSKDFGEGDIPGRLVNFKYILYVGQRNAYKRFDWFVIHLKPFMEKHKDINVICTGLPFNAVEVNLIRSFGFESRFFSSYVTDVQLASLYKYAECFVYPSEYEGFGIPILESYKMECPVLLNDNGCFREVTFGQGEYFNLEKNDSNLSERLDYIVSNPKSEFMAIRDRVLKTYSWENTANKLKKIFTDVAYDRQ